MSIKRRWPLLAVALIAGFLYRYGTPPSHIESAMTPFFALCLLAWGLYWCIGEDVTP